FAASIAGLALKPLSPQELSPHPASGKIDWLYQLRWQERPALATAATASRSAARWLIMADRDGVGDALADMRNGRRARCHIIRLDELLASPVQSGDSDDLLARASAALARLVETSSPTMRGVIDLWPLDVKTDTPALDDLASGQKIAVGAAAAVI